MCRPPPPAARRPVHTAGSGFYQSAQIAAEFQLSLVPSGGPGQVRARHHSQHVTTDSRPQLWNRCAPVSSQWNLVYGSVTIASLSALLFCVHFHSDITQTDFVAFIKVKVDHHNNLRSEAGYVKCQLLEIRNMVVGLNVSADDDEAN